MNGKPVIDGTLITLSEDLASGNDGCNNYGMVSRRDDPPHVIARITQSDGSSAEGEFSARIAFVTRLGCEGRHEKQADAYQTALKEGERFRIKGDWLEILDGGRRTTLVFSPQPPLPGKQLDLVRTQWRGMEGDKSFILAFLEDEVAVGVDECQGYIGKYRTSNRLSVFGRVLSISGIQPCWEDSFRAVLGTEQYSVIGEEGSEILLLGKRSGEPLTLESLPDVALDTERKEWTLTGIIDFNTDEPGWNLRAVTKAVPTPTVTLSFQETHISGSAGCNSYQAPLTIDEEAIDIDPVSKTAVSCRHMENFNAVIRQEVHYLELLSQVTRGLTVASRLFLSTGTGIYLIFEAE